MIKPLEYLSDAPCYWLVANDGAKWRCQCCLEQGEAGEMLGALTPDSTFKIYHRVCIDKDWILKSKLMKGRI